MRMKAGDAIVEGRELFAAALRRTLAAVVKRTTAGSSGDVGDRTGDGVQSSSWGSGGRAGAVNEEEANMLNRVIRAYPEDWEYECDQRHGEHVLEELQIMGASHLVWHPGR